MAVTLAIPDKVALITGGSRGIGAACVRMFVEAGAKVVFSYQKARGEAERLVAQCGPEVCLGVQAELSKVEQARALVQAAVRRFGRLDIVVANHGIWPPDDAPIDEMTESQWAATIAINLDSVFGLVKYAVAQMKKQPASPTLSRKTGDKGGPPESTSLENSPLKPKAGLSGATREDGGLLEFRSAPYTVDPGPRRATAGHIVIISSTAGQRGEAYHCDYAATKGAVISMTKGLSTELAAHGIYVNCVAPGWVATDMAAPALNDPATRERVFRSIPLGRVATPEEVAGPILFLCTEHAGFINGEVFNVNGGAVLIG